jgi:uncharacterized protein (TIGR02391 family)
MAKRGTPPPPQEPKLSPAQMQAAIARFQRRVDELQAFDPQTVRARNDPKIDALEAAIGEALTEAFGYQTPTYQRYAAAATLDTASVSYVHQIPIGDVIRGLLHGKERAIVLLNQAKKSFEERLADQQPNDHYAGAKILRAYDGLDLHPSIARAASDLYRNGHYANAIEDAVKALNNLVRLCSDVDGDGTSLMETVFSPKKPILRFNDLQDQSDQDEQKGFMMMFSGAVAGLRNPRAHRLIKDDPERALEFIAFVSLLAKLLDGAKK